jgi:hypothetical protein
MGDNQYIWVKPVDMLTIRMGNLYDDTLRGNAAFGSFSWYRGLGNGDGEDITFSRIGINRSREGFELAVAPMDNLYAALYFYNLDKNLTENMFKNMQFAVGYTIDGLGQFKAQVYTQQQAEMDTVSTAAVYGWVDHDKDASTEPVWNVTAPAGETKVATGDFEQQLTFEVAFNLTMIENLFVEAGFKMVTNNDYPAKIAVNRDIDADGDIDGDDAVEAEDFKQFAVYAKYNMDAMTLHFSTINKMFKGEDTEVMYKLIGGVDYDMGDGIGISADVSYTGVTVDNVDGIVTFFAGATKGFSNGKIGAGVQVLNDGEDTHFGIPVLMEYWF